MIICHLILRTSLLMKRVVFVYVKKHKKTLLFAHLQFADDTLLLGGKCRVNARVLKAVLILFMMI